MGPAPEPLSRYEALVAVAYCAVFADGSMEAAEDERLAEQLSGCHALRGCDETLLRAAMMKADAFARERGEEALLALAAASLSQELRETAFCLAADLVLADGEIAGEERAFVGHLRERLGVEESLASRVVEVLLIRNRA